MNKEIKEILDKLEKVANKETASRNALMEMKDTDYRKLLGYITNLEQENERLKEDIETISASHFSVFKRYDNYEKRIDKAIEYLKPFMELDCIINGRMLIPLLNILKGEENE